jgi:hypothetical protein
MRKINKYLSDLARSFTASFLTFVLVLASIIIAVIVPKPVQFITATYIANIIYGGDKTFLMFAQAVGLHESGVTPYFFNSFKDFLKLFTFKYNKYVKANNFFGMHEVKDSFRKKFRIGLRSDGEFGSKLKYEVYLLPLFSVLSFYQLKKDSQMLGGKLSGHTLDTLLKQHSASGYYTAPKTLYDAAIYRTINDLKLPYGSHFFYPIIAFGFLVSIVSAEIVRFLKLNLTFSNAYRRKRPSGKFRKKQH